MSEAIIDLQNFELRQMRPGAISGATRSPIGISRSNAWPMRGCRMATSG
jgi:hypothetical protein